MAEKEGGISRGTRDLENKKKVASRRLSQEDNKEGEPRERQEQKKNMGRRRSSCRNFQKKKDLRLILEKRRGIKGNIMKEKKGEMEVR